MTRPSGRSLARIALGLGAVALLIVSEVAGVELSDSTRILLDSTAAILLGGAVVARGRRKRPDRDVPPPPPIPE